MKVGAEVRVQLGLKLRVGVVREVSADSVLVAVGDLFVVVALAEVRS